MARSLALSRIGVIYVMTEAAGRGFRYGHPERPNLGQGAPETGPLPRSLPRLTSIPLDDASHGHVPVAGLWERREAVADLRFCFGPSLEAVERGLTRLGATVERHREPDPETIL